MKYYVVALFDEDSSTILNPTQKFVSKKFRANKNLPKPYIPLAILDNPNVDKLNLVLDKVLKPYKKFKVETTNELMILDDAKTLNLKLSNRGYITKISHSFSDLLKLYGFNIKESSIINPSVCLSNFTYYPRDSKKKLADSVNFLSTDSLKLKVNSFEIWKVPHNKHEVKLKEHELKVF